MTRTRTGVVSAAFFLLAAAVALTRPARGEVLGHGPGFASKAGGEAGETGENNAAQVIRENDRPRSSSGEPRPGHIRPRWFRAKVSRARTRDVQPDRSPRRTPTRSTRAGCRSTGTSGSSTARRRTPTEPGVISFSGATNNTASRVTALVADPTATPTTAASGRESPAAACGERTTPLVEQPGVEADPARRASTRTRSGR